jgi:uncharacterized protein YggE
MLKRAVLFLLFPLSLAFSQVAAGSLTVTATRSQALTPDQAVLSVTVTSPLSTTRDQVVAALQGSGVTLANFQGVSSVSDYATPPTIQLYWSFTFTTALSNLKSTFDQLAAVTKSVAQTNSKLSLNYSVQSTQVSDALMQAHPCVASDLLSDARTQAQQLADAARLTLGPVVAMSSPGASSGTCNLTVKFATYPQ